MRGLSPGSSQPGALRPGSVQPGPLQAIFDSPREPLTEALPGLADLSDLSGMPERPARIVLYRRPLMARADGQEELAELVLDVIVEQFAHWLGVDPQTVEPSYPAED